MPNAVEARNPATTVAQGAETGAAPRAVALTIDDTPVQVAPGTTILDAARQVGIEIPTLCFLRDINDIGSCRVCSVEIAGQDELAPACNTPVEEGMEIHTATNRVLLHRRTVLQLIISQHGLNSTAYCFSCKKNGACELQKVCRDNDVTEPVFPAPEKNAPVLDSNPFLTYDPNLCISCQRCVAACNRQACNHTLQSGKRGVRTTIQAPFGPDWKETDCESCGCCAAACPTGALVEKRRSGYRDWEVEKVLTTCPHCAIGCQYYLLVKDGKIVDTEAAPGSSNQWRLCVKGRSASFDFIDAPDRLTAPLVKNRDTGEFEATGWDEALDLIANRFSEIKRETGPESLAAFACSRSTNEDVYLLQKMARTAFGTNNVDNCARV